MLLYKIPLLYKLAKLRRLVPLFWLLVFNDNISIFVRHADTRFWNVIVDVNCDFLYGVFELTTALYQHKFLFFYFFYFYH